MDKKLSMGFIGGDKRQLKAIDILADIGYKIYAFGVDIKNHPNVVMCTDIESALQNSEIIILPIPYKNTEGFINIKGMKITLDKILNNINKNSIIILGKKDMDFISFAKKNGVSWYDLLDEETFSILNAIPSAEGAIQRALEITDITLHDSSVLILGYGRIGKILANILQGFGAKITVEARNETDLSWIYANGFNHVSLNDIDRVLPYQDIIFNTIPHLILDKEKLDKVEKNCVIIDLASYPGGVDYQYAKICGINANHELGLPGKVAPKTAAIIVCKVIENIIKRHYIRKGEEINEFLR